MASNRRVEVLCGLSGSGKTTAALRRYADQVRRHGEDTALLILPTARAVRRAWESLVTPGPLPGLLDPRLLTFPQLAQLVLDANHECATSVGPGARALLLKEAVSGLAAAGELGDLAEVSDLPGFTAALGELIADLKRAAVRPKQFCAALRTAGLPRRAHRELGGLYCAYQWLLICLRYFDEEGQFWLARDVLREGRRRPLERVELMIVDGFTDFTTTQLDMLAVLSEGIPQTLITLDYSPDDAREGLAPWFRDTLQRLAQSLGGLHVEFLPVNPEGGPLAHLRGNVFAAGAVPRASAESRVHLLGCPSRSRETREVLARVKGLLVDGRARPADIAIVARDLPERAQEIEHVARRMGVPVHIESPRLPLDSPAVRAVLHAQETVIEGYRREDVLALLRSTCFTFEALTSRGLTAEDVAWAAEDALVVEGRPQWRRRLRGLSEHLARSRHEGRRARAPAVEAVAEALEDVFGLLPDARRKRSLPQRVAELREFVARTSVWRNVARGDLAGHASANLRALEQLERALDELEHVRPGAVGAGVSPAAFHRLLRELLGDLADQPPAPAGERVSVLRPDQARQARFGITFVLGLCEGDFPRKPREEPFFSPAELTRLERAGVMLERRRGPEAYEPLLFYGAVASAERELWLTRPSADLDGKPLQPSHYLREVRRLFDEATLDVREIPVSQLVAPRGDVCDPHELADVAFLDLAAGPGTESPVAYNALVRLPEGRARVPRVVEAVRIGDLRDSPNAAGLFVGEMGQPALIADLGARFGAERRFTASDLNAFAACPFDFLCQCALGLTEVEYASADIDPRVAGTVRHAILAAFAKARLEARPGQPLVAPGEEEAALAELGALIETEFRRCVARGGVADEALWEVEQERCRRDMQSWVREEVARFGDHRPVRAEFPFGSETERPGDPDVAGTTRTAAVCLPGRDDIFLSGRIDRVNLLPDAAAFALLDYKSGRPPSGADVKQGLDVQFPIYAIGAEAGVPELAGAACAGWLYCRVTRPTGVSGLKKAEDIAQVRGEIEPQIAAHVDAIRAGRFSYLTVPRCAAHCASAAVCRHDARWWSSEEGEADEDS